VLRIAFVLLGSEDEGDTSSTMLDAVGCIGAAGAMFNCSKQLESAHNCCEGCSEANTDTGVLPELAPFQRYIWCYDK
jgi:hypothetical protein